MCSRLIFSMYHFFLPTLLYTIIFFTAIVISTTTTTPIVGGDETDRVALLAFKSSILQDPKRSLTSWNDSLHHCEWEGVTCGSTNVRVISLNIQSKGLIGSLSPFIGNMSFLRVINLRNNSFQGEIPPQLGQLVRLQNLSLNTNFFGGDIPSTISNCSKMLSLDLGTNQLVGNIPDVFGSLSELKILWVFRNNLTGQVPSSIGNLTSLQSLAATYNFLTGNLPNSIGQLRNLNDIGMGANELSGTIPPPFYNLTLLTIVSFSYNKLQGVLPQSLGLTLPRLKILQLAGNQLSGPLPCSLSNATQLESLDIPFNDFTGKISIDFSNLQKLWALSLAGTNLGSGEPDELSFLVSLSNCTSLLVVELGINKLRGELPSNPGNFSTGLYYLSLMENRVYGNIPSWIGDLVGLTQLLLNDNEFSGTLPTSIGNLRKLQKLALHNNSITGEVPSSFGQLTSLNEITLNNNKLQGNIPPSLGDCQDLLSLDLSVNNFSSTIPKEIFSISTLSKLLNLSHNHLFGTLPAEVGKLRNLVALDLSDNDLSGEIPNNLGQCTSLVNLFMDGNLFQGSIPATLSSLRGIAILDLSRNNFSGQIPNFLETFSLTSLNLSYNDFEGEVPRKGIFANSSAISVGGNTKLCGGISELQLPRCTFSEQKKRKVVHARREIFVATMCAVIGAILVSSSLYFWSKRKTKVASKDLRLKEQFINLSYDNLLKATDGFSSENLIGAGSFGSVYKGTLEQEERVVAVKVFNLQNERASKSFMAECEALRVVRHRNLIKILSCCSSIDFQGNDFKALIYEFMPNGSLEKWIHMTQEANSQQDRSQMLNFHQRLKIAIDVAVGLDYLHNNQGERPIVHCDLKPSNILLDADMVACVGDFGLAKFIPRSYVDQNQNSSIGIRGTVGYAAPEYGLGNEVSVMGDIYSYGILVLEMMTGKRPTDPMFQEGINLHKFAEMFFPDRLIQVLDPILLHHLNEAEASTSTNINPRVSQANNYERMEKCLVSMVKIGISCSMDSVKNRMDITDVLRELNSINSILNGAILSGTS